MRNSKLPARSLRNGYCATTAYGLNKESRVFCSRESLRGQSLANGDLNWIANFIWGIADDVLRDVYVRGKYRDVILPMVVIRRLDAILEPTKEAVLRMKDQLNQARVANQAAALCQASGEDTEEFQRKFPVGAVLLLKTDIVISADDRGGKHI